MVWPATSRQTVSPERAKSATSSTNELFSAKVPGTGVSGTGAEGVSSSGADGHSGTLPSLALAR